MRAANHLVLSRPLVVVSVVACLCLWVVLAHGIPLAEVQDHRPLDLPTGVGKHEEDDEEPVDVIEIHGTFIEAQGFFFYLAAKTHVALDPEFVRREVINAITQLSKNAWFTVVDHGVDPYGSDAAEATLPRVWSQKLKRATAGNKAAAIRLINGLDEPILVGWSQDHGGYCIVKSALTTVRLANRRASRVTNKAFVFVGDWAPRCHGMGNSVTAYRKEVLAEITAANFRSIPLHTIHINHPIQADLGDSDAKEFWQALAASNRGTYTQVKVE